MAKKTSGFSTPAIGKILPKETNLKTSKRGVVSPVKSSKKSNKK